MRDFINRVLEMYRRPVSNYGERAVRDSIAAYQSVLPFRNQENKLVGRIGEYDICETGYDDEETFLVLDDGKVIAYLDTYSDEIEHFGVVHVTNAIGVVPEYRGAGLAISLYRYLILSRSWILLSDHRHTPDGEALWKKLFREPDIEIMGWDTGSHVSFPVKDIDAVYRDDFIHQDDDYIELDEHPHVRLIAMKR